MIRFACPSCSAVLETPNHQASKRATCPRCGQSSVVPPQDTTVPAACSINPCQAPEGLTASSRPAEHSRPEVTLSWPLRPFGFVLPRTGQLAPVQVLGLAGCALLLVGVFLPFVSVPILGSTNYIGNGRWDGILILIVATMAALLT